MEALNALVPVLADSTNAYTLAAILTVAAAAIVVVVMRATSRSDEDEHI
ncbi:MAG: hypothetical protein U9N56_00080 [Actinomycetota bacterium]|nr:hypothetical protein [Actinomycetota bacterium]